MWTKKKVFISKYARIFTNSRVKTKKKALHLKKCANFYKFRSETTRIKDLYYKICKKTVLVHEFWGDNQYLGSLRPKSLISNPRVWTKKKVFISKYARIFTNSRVKTKKKALHLKKCANFYKFRSETTRIKDLYYKICKKTVLVHEFWGDNQYLGSLRPRTAL